VNIHKIYVLPVIYTVVISSLRPVKVTKTVQTDFVHDIIDVSKFTAFETGKPMR